MPLGLSAASAEKFTRFVRRWNRTQGFILPKIHELMIDFLCDCIKRRRRYIYLVAFRNSGKSTIMGLLAAWLLKCDPSLRILVLTADILLSCKMVRHIRTIIEEHPDTRRLKLGSRRPRGQYQWTGGAIHRSPPGCVARPVGVSESLEHQLHRV